MGRFLRIQIYNSSNTVVQYDNSADDFWGIDTGTALLNRVLMPDELKFGELYSDMFEVNIFGLDNNIDLKGRRIRVLGTQDNIYTDRLKNDNNDRIVNADADYIATAPTISTEEYVLFDGYIETSDTDIVKTDRQIVAYDESRTLKNTDIASWWNTYWENNPNGVTIATFRDALMSAVGVTHVSINGIPVNDNVVIKNPFENDMTSLMFGTVLKMICQLQCTAPTVIPPIAAQYNHWFEFIALGDGGNDVSTDKNLEGLNSKWEDYITDTITGVAVYSTSDELAQLVGTTDNAYKIAGNAFLLNMSATDITTIGTAILNRLATISYTPCELNLVVSDFRHKLGDKVTTSNGNAYILEQTFSGSLLINENIICPAISPKLSGVVDDVSDELINGQKFAKITKTIDEFSSVIYDPVTGESKIQQLSDEILLKVDSQGRLVLVKLGVDPDEGTTQFIINANTIDIESDTVKFDNNGYQVKGDVYTTKITPDNHEIFCNYNEVDHDNFPDVNFENDTKALEYINTYLYGQSFYNDRTPYANELRSFNLQIIRNNQFTHLESGTNLFVGQTIIHGTHFVIRPDKWTAYVSAGGYIHDDGTLEFITNMPTYIEEDMFEVSIMQMVPRTNPIIAYLEGGLADAALNLIPKPTDPQGVIIDAHGKVPIVIAPNISISQENIYDWNNKWGGNDYGLVNTTGQLWNRAMNNPVTRAGTIVKTITTANPQKIFTAQELANIFGTQSGGTYTAYLMNGDHSAQGADIIATYIQSGEVYARFSGTPTAGNYRFNYTISRY